MSGICFSSGKANDTLQILWYTRNLYCNSECMVTTKRLCFLAAFCMETFTSAPPLGCTANYGNRVCLGVHTYYPTGNRVPGKLPGRVPV